MSRHRPRTLLGLLLFAYLLLGVIYSFATPIFEASDEPWHYAVVREIVTNHQLPVQVPGVKTTWEHEGSQPPLYYFLGALLTAGVDISDYDAHAVENPFSQMGIPGTTNNVNMRKHIPGQMPWDGGTPLAVFLIRWFSLLLGAGTVYFTYRLARTLTPSREWLPLLAAALVAFNPMVLFINASVNNDNLIILLSTIALWLIAVELTDDTPGAHWSRTLMLGVIIGLAAVTKISGTMLLPTVALAFTFRAWKERAWGAWVLRGLVIAVAVLLIAGWWYVRNWHLYGDWMGMEQWVLITGPRPANFVPTDIFSEYISFLYGFWGVFGGFNILSPAWFFLMMRIIALVALAGLVVHLIRSLKAREFSHWPIHVTLITYILFSLIGILRLTLLFPTTQGRLIFSGLSIIAFYTALGLLTWVSRRLRRPVAGSLMVILFASALIIPFVSIFPAYRPPTPVADLPADIQPVNIRYGDHIQLLGYKLQNTRVEPGESLDITLYWKTDAPLEKDYDLSLNGYGYKEENVAKLDTWPGGGLMPTSLWQTDVIYPDRYQLPIIPDATTPTLLRLGVQFSEDLVADGVGKPLPVYADGQSVGAVLLDVGDLITPPDRIQHPTEPPIARFGPTIQLHSYNTDLSDTDITLTAIWSATGPVPEDYTIFVHLVDDQGNLIAQNDGPPREGYWPTSHWQPGEAVDSLNRIPLPRPLAPGDYTLLIGMYNPQTGERLAVHEIDGPDLPDRALPLPLTRH